MIPCKHRPKLMLETLITCLTEDQIQAIQYQAQLRHQAQQQTQPGHEDSQQGSAKVHSLKFIMDGQVDIIHDIPTQVTSSQCVTGEVMQQQVPQEHQEEQVLAARQEQQPPRRYPVRVRNQDVPKLPKSR